MYVNPFLGFHMREFQPVTLELAHHRTGAQSIHFLCGWVFSAGFTLSPIRLEYIA